MTEQVYQGHETQSTLSKVHENLKILKQDLTYMGHQLNHEHGKLCNVVLFLVANDCFSPIISCKDFCI